MSNNCLICGWKNCDVLCSKHNKSYVYDSKLDAIRLKKKSNGSRYTVEKHHLSEIKLTKVLESYYGKSNVFTGFHPLWAITSKGVLYEYDIFIKPNILVEYNGVQHYVYPNYFHKTKEEFLEQVRRDNRKARLARVNGYKLIVFKYNESDFEDYIINKIGE